MELAFHHRDMNWSISNGTSLCGTIMVADDVIPLEELDAKLSNCHTIDEISAAIKDFNGFYALARVTDRDIIAAADRMRSIPLFYGHNEKGIYCSDDPFWIQDRMGDHTMDEVAMKEFRLSGYVTRDQTLSPKVKQLRAGEMVCLSLDPEGRVMIDRAPYQRYKPGDYLDRDLEVSLKELDKAMVNSFQRLIRVADGRALVVPLSGGYDSRLIVLMLKKLGYKNVITFSYGRPGNPESQISKIVADNLDFRWEFIEYSNENWLRWYQSDENWAYYPMGSGLASLPHIQEMPAVKFLKENHSIPDDSIFLPGHTIANPSQYANLQGHSVKDKANLTAYKEDTPNETKEAVIAFPIDRLIDDLITDNYNLKGRPINDRTTLSEMKSLVLNALDNIGGYDNYVSAYEYWNFNERQVKYIFNSIRTYEFWGYGWWLPLLDKELMDFWRRLSLEQRYDKKVIRVYTDRLSKELMKDFEIPHDPRTLEKKGYSRVISAILKRKSIWKLMEIPYFYRKKATMYGQEPQAYFGMLTKERYQREYTGREIINYFTASDYIDWLTRTSGGN